MEKRFHDLNNVIFPPQNICIYCGGQKELTDEHIVPYALGSNGKLPKASCKKCAKVTGKFEQEILRGGMWGLRTHLKLSSRRKKEMPKHLPIQILKNGDWENENIPIQEHPILQTFPIFTAPSLITKKHVSGIGLKGFVSYEFGKSLPIIKEEKNVDNTRYEDKVKPVSFARMIAKIAWAMAFAHGLKESLDYRLPKTIINVPNNIGRWVGTYPDPLKARKGELHSVNFRRDDNKGILFGDIQLFSIAPTPIYGVILGHIK